jgi:uridine kinase
MSASVPVPREPLIVGIGGGVGGAGRSALAQALVGLLGPGQTAFLAQDLYYREDGAPLPDVRAFVNGGIPGAFAHGVFLRHLAALRAGLPVRPPVRSLLAHRRTDGATVVTPRPVVVVEGTFLFWEPAVRAALDLKIYLEMPDRVWLERRLAREAAERGQFSDRAQVRLAASARDAHRHCVEPTRAMADLVLHTAGPVQPIAEVAAAVILDRLARQRPRRARIAS